MILVQNCRMIDPASQTDGLRDILIGEDRITKIAEAGTINPAQITKEKEDELRILNADGLIAAPGLVDTHVHFRDPGAEYKEDILTGAVSAAAGGVTSVVLEYAAGPRAGAGQAGGRSRADDLHLEENQRRGCECHAGNGTIPNCRRLVAGRARDRRLIQSQILACTPTVVIQARPLGVSHAAPFLTVFEQVNARIFGDCGNHAAFKRWTGPKPQSGGGVNAVICGRKGGRTCAAGRAVVNVFAEHDHIGFAADGFDFG